MTRAESSLQLLASDVTIYSIPNKACTLPWQPEHPCAAPRQKAPPSEKHQPLSSRASGTISFPVSKHIFLSIDHYATSVKLYQFNQLRKRVHSEPATPYAYFSIRSIHNIRIISKKFITKSICSMCARWNYQFSWKPLKSHLWGVFVRRNGNSVTFKYTEEHSAHQEYNLHW